MTETPDQIRQEVEHAQHRLVQDFNALQNRVKEVTDWRWQFRRRPWAILGAAFATALLAGVVFGKQR